MHDFNPGIRPSGLFWIVQVPDDALQIKGNNVTVRLKDVAVSDNFFFLGPGNVASTVSFEITYTRSGAPRQVRPVSSDPTSPFSWAGEMWMATAVGSFTASYSGGGFSAQGNLDSTGLFAEVGTERNGFFVQ